MRFDIEKFNSAAKNVKEGTLRNYVVALEKINQFFRRHKTASLSDAIIALTTGTEQTAIYIAAVKKYERDVLDSPMSLLYGEDLTNLRALKPKAIGRNLRLGEHTYSHKINAIRNEKLKIALKLQLKSGLRIAEVAALRREDIDIDVDAGEVTVRVIRGKRDKSRTVQFNATSFAPKLSAFIDNSSDSKLFYSASYLKKKCAELGIVSHDLRRLASKNKFREELANGAGRTEARLTVQKLLGHEKAAITSAYLGTDWKEDE